LYPATGDEVAFQDSATLCVPVPDCTPDPLNEAVAELDPLVTKARLPVDVPAACGVNETVNGTLCPADNVTGKLIPLKVYPWPV
jgi:hypothetical protein